MESKRWAVAPWLRFLKGLKGRLTFLGRCFRVEASLLAPASEPAPRQRESDSGEFACSEQRSSSHACLRKASDSFKATHQNPRWHRRPRYPQLHAGGGLLGIRHAERARAPSDTHAGRQQRHPHIWLLRANKIRWPLRVRHPVRDAILHQRPTATASPPPPSLPQSPRPRLTAPVLQPIACSHSCVRSSPASLEGSKGKVPKKFCRQTSLTALCQKFSAG